MSETVDLRSDAVTRPTERMWTAMRADPLQWSRIADATVRRLEERAAGLLGTADALLTPSGTMGNVLALLAWTRHGDRFIAERRSHVITSEDQAFARLAGLHAELLPGDRGRLSPDQVAAALASRHLGVATRTPLVWLENTHTAAGGCATSAARIRAIEAAAGASGAAVHLDGARLFNAAIALDTPARSFVPERGSVTINLNKGLSAPAGGVLCGPSDLIREARQRMLGLGGVLSNAGLLAAAGLVALEDEMIERLRDDHDIAAALAQALSELPDVTLQRPETNIVRLELPSGIAASDAVAQLARNGVLALPYGEGTIRLVTHRHIEARHIMRVVAAFEAVLGEPGAAKGERK
jgi:threonine aldolase